MSRDHETEGRVRESNSERTITIGDERAGGLGIRLDANSGLPSELILHGEGGGAASVPVAISVSATTGGVDETRRPVQDHYRSADRLPHPRPAGPPTVRSNEGGHIVVGRGLSDGWSLEWRVILRPSNRPRISFQFAIAPPADDAPHVLRDLDITITLVLDGGLVGWQVFAPGNSFPSRLRAEDVAAALEISPAGGLQGSSGLVVVAHPGRGSIVWWPVNSEEIGRQRVIVEGQSVHLAYRTGLAGVLTTGDQLVCREVGLDFVQDGWPSLRNDIRSWIDDKGLSAPIDKPAWAENCSIFEVQLGYSRFLDCTYSPYPTVTQLIDDLPRIQGLGFDVIQVMPRQPYPSYNVHDYADVEVSYAPEAEFKALVDRCHELGLRVIIDVLLHGVVDRRSVRRTADEVRRTDLVGRLHEETTRPWGTSAAAKDQMNVAWARHILDFEDEWEANAPDEHPLVRRHPEWFMRTQSQQITGIYSNAFDVANPDWQDAFAVAMERLLLDYDVDGFRFDAPTYNEIPDWSSHRATRASRSPLGSLDLFRKLRRRLKALSPSVLLYTEPSGMLFHRDMDLTYNYDEQWLVPAVLDSGASPAAPRLTGRSLATWLCDRNAALPENATLAHHVDSHDTFWWPLPGQKWRREQFGVSATQALIAIFGLSGGALMTFVGGELGLEEAYRRVNGLRRDRDDIGFGTAEYDRFQTDTDDLYIVCRSSDRSRSLVLVNTTNAPLEARISPNGTLKMPRSTGLPSLWDPGTIVTVEDNSILTKLGPYGVEVVDLSS